jgi:hypothetical protein
MQEYINQRKRPRQSGQADTNITKAIIATELANPVHPAATVRCSMGRQILLRQ